MICNHKGQFSICGGCLHAVAHDPVKAISTTTPGRGRTCRSAGACVLVAMTGRRMDGEAVAKVRCAKV